MKSKLPLLTIAAWTLAAGMALAQAPQSATGAPLEQGESFVSEAAARMHRQTSMQTKIRQRVMLLGHSIEGEGRYLQSGAAGQKKLRLELAINVGGQTARIEQISDGRFLWLRRQTPAASRLGRVDLRRIQQAAADTSALANIDTTSNWIMFGGLPKMLQGLANNFQFTAPRSGQLNGEPIWIVEGTWKAEKLGEMFPEKKESWIQARTVAWEELPPHIPQRVVLGLGQDDMFPYRVEFLRAGQGRGGQGRAPLTPIVSLEFYEVQIAAPVDPMEFECQVGDAVVNDHTDIYLQKMGLVETASKDVDRK